MNQDDRDDNFVDLVTYSDQEIKEDSFGKITAAEMDQIKKDLGYDQF